MSIPIEEARSLRQQGRHPEARVLLRELAARFPQDAEVQYEMACVHDFLGMETEAIPFYVAALAGQLSPDQRRGAFVGLGSTYRALGRYHEAETTLRQGLAEFPDASDLKVFLAMALHNVGRSKEAVEGLLMLLARTSADADIRGYARAIEFYAQDVQRTWSDGEN